MADAASTTQFGFAEVVTTTTSPIGSTDSCREATYTPPSLTLSEAWPNPTTSPLASTPRTEAWLMAVGIHLDQTSGFSLTHLHALTECASL